MEKRGREYIIKKTFADAYLELAEEKTLRKISVSDIAGRCGLSRVTFYNHFNEKLDLLLWTYVSVFGDMMEELKDYDGWMEKNTRFLAEHESFFMQAYRYTDFLDWQKNWICRNMCSFIACEYGEEELTDSLKYQIQSYVFGAFSIFRSRLENNEKHIIADSSALDLKNMPEGLRRYFPERR